MTEIEIRTRPTAELKMWRAGHALRPAIARDHRTWKAVQKELRRRRRRHGWPNRSRLDGHGRNRRTRKAIKRAR